MSRYWYLLQCEHGFKSGFAIHPLSKVKCGKCHKIVGIKERKLLE